MSMRHNILLIGDSNFLISHESNSGQKISVGKLLESKSTNMHTLNIKNISTWGATLFDFYNTYIVKGPIPNLGIQTIVVGFGTNDSNYYYSLNSNLCSSELHFALLNNMIEILFASSETLERILMVPVPPVLIKSDEKRNIKINKCIEDFNKMRQKIAQDNRRKVLYANEIRYEQSKHLIKDGYHLNACGIIHLANGILGHLSGTY